MSTYSLLCQEDGTEAPELWEPALIAQFTTIDDAVTALEAMVADAKGREIFWVADPDQLSEIFNSDEESDA